MRLTALIPALSPELVSSLDKCGVRTDSDLLFRPVVEVYLQLSSEDGISLLDLERAVELTAELASAPGIAGDELLAQETQAQEQAPTLFSGVGGLDNLLCGFGGCRVIEITGDKQSGKTTLALNVILRHLSEVSQARIAWIDTTGDFSVEHAAQILKTFNSEATSSALNRLQVSLAFDIEAAYNALEESQPLPATRLSCIVFDAITPLLGPLLSAVSAQGHSAMTEFMYHLRDFSRLHSCPILVINNTSLLVHHSKSASQIRKPALGPSFEFLTDATVWLSRCDEHAKFDNDHDFTVVSAKVLRSRTTAPKTDSMFKISKGKIFDL
ncbi:DNA repair protein RAD51 like protein [Termitomyces sp. T112]|nr:DNA repair protein RAD51 like protein [Termitomyces sp. T112]KAH0585013.1 hypothetical protein H2248_008282 [Termitomyces sp. 'cryptogamus']